ncbi:MAG: hypothetical protein ACO35C_07105, partial [Pontimonas sp.]
MAGESGEWDIFPEDREAHGHLRTGAVHGLGHGAGETGGAASLTSADLGDSERISSWSREPMDLSEPMGASSPEFEGKIEVNGIPGESATPVNFGSAGALPTSLRGLGGDATQGNTDDKARAVRPLGGPARIDSHLATLALVLRCMRGIFTAAALHFAAVGLALLNVVLRLGSVLSLYGSGGPVTLFLVFSLFGPAARAFSIDASELSWGPAQDGTHLPVWLSLLGMAIAQAGLHSFRRLGYADGGNLANYPDEEVLSKNVMRFVKLNTGMTTATADELAGRVREITSHFLDIAWITARKSLLENSTALAAFDKGHDLKSSLEAMAHFFRLIIPRKKAVAMQQICRLMATLDQHLHDLGETWLRLSVLRQRAGDEDVDDKFYRAALAKLAVDHVPSQALWVLEDEGKDAPLDSVALRLQRQWLVDREAEKFRQRSGGDSFAGGAVRGNRRNAGTADSRQPASSEPRLSRRKRGRLRHADDAATRGTRGSQTLMHGAKSTMAMDRDGHAANRASPASSSQTLMEMGVFNPFQDGFFGAAALGAFAWADIRNSEAVQPAVGSATRDA